MQLGLSANDPAARENLKKEEYLGIDIAKFFFSICVIALHTVLSTGNVTGFGAFFFKHIVCRTAVPFFLYAAGYFFANSIKKANFQSTVLKKYLMRLLPPYLFWGIIASIMNFIHGQSILEMLHHWLVGTPGNAMWFVSALMCSAAIIYWGDKHHFGKLLMGGALCMYLIGLFTINTYAEMNVIEFPQTVARAIKVYLAIGYGARNALFVGGLFFGMGYYSFMYSIVQRYRNTAKFMLVSGIICVIFESCLLYRFAGFSASETDYFIGHIILVPSLFVVLANLKIPIMNSRKIRKYSTAIYFSHITFLRVFNFVCGVLSVNNNMLMAFFFVVATTLAWAVIVNLIPCKWLQRIAE